MDDHDWEHQLYANELMQERYRMACEALQRCLEKGTDEEDIKTLCRETGVNVKDVLCSPQINRLG
jgi:hypothetical protein